MAPTWFVRGFERGKHPETEKISDEIPSTIIKPNADCRLCQRHTHTRARAQAHTRKIRKKERWTEKERERERERNVRNDADRTGAHLSGRRWVALIGSTKKGSGPSPSDDRPRYRPMTAARTRHAGRRRRHASVSARLAHRPPKKKTTLATPNKTPKKKQPTNEKPPVGSDRLDLLGCNNSNNNKSEEKLGKKNRKRNLTESENAVELRLRKYLENAHSSNSVRKTRCIFKMPNGRG